MLQYGNHGNNLLHMGGRDQGSSQKIVPVVKSIRSTGSSGILKDRVIVWVEYRCGGMFCYSCGERGVQDVAMHHGECSGRHVAPREFLSYALLLIFVFLDSFASFCKYYSAFNYLPQRYHKSANFLFIKFFAKN